MKSTIQALNPAEFDNVFGGIALPPEPTIQDYIDIAEEAEETTMWRLTRYTPVSIP
jgi:hypothetical protein